MTTVSSHPPRTRRNVELVLLLLAVGIVVLAYVNVSLAVSGSVPPGLTTQVAGLLVLAVGFHLLLRWKAAYADPLLLPIVTLLNGLGLVMIHRLDLAHGRTQGEGLALKQLTWSALSVAIPKVRWDEDLVARAKDLLERTAGLLEAG